MPDHLDDAKRRKEKLRGCLYVLTCITIIVTFPTVTRLLPASFYYPVIFILALIAAFFALLKHSS